MPTSSVSDFDADVVVVGGGPAGASAATVLARRGLSVVLVDKATFPRDKCCGDGLTAWALRELEDLGLDPRAVPSWHVVDGAVVCDPTGREIRLPFPGRGTYAAVARRHDLDAAVLDLARKAGADVRESVTCTGAAQSADAVTVHTDDGRSCRARYAIGADGIWSPLRRHLSIDIGTYRGDWHAFRQYFTGVTGRAADELLVWFEPDFLPGYAWSFPLGDGTANLGFGILRDGRWRVGAMGQLWAEILERPQVRAALGPDARAESPTRAWPIPCQVGRVPLTSGRVLFVGDAAAVADLLTGEGIGQALATGRWAADAIADARTEDPHDSGSAGAAYAAAAAHHLVADDRMSRWLGRAIGHRKGVRTALRIVDTNAWTRRNFARWLFEDYPRAQVFTPARWHRGAIARPGAYP